jgi:plasmid stabilization system protein ParE
VKLRASAKVDEDLDAAFAYYENQRIGLGIEFLEEFRRAVDRIIKHPTAWALLDEETRRCQLRRFPYGVVYEIDVVADEIRLTHVFQMNQHPSKWRTK